MADASWHVALARLKLAVRKTDWAPTSLDRRRCVVEGCAGHRPLRSCKTGYGRSGPPGPPFLAPLLGPTSNTERAWHEYLREAVGWSIGDANSPSTTVLRDPSASDYAVSEQWVRDALTDSYADEVALSSLSETNLVSVFAKVGASTPRGSLLNVTAFIAISDTNWPRTVTALRAAVPSLFNSILPNPSCNEVIGSLVDMTSDHTPLGRSMSILRGRLPGCGRTRSSAAPCITVDVSCAAGVWGAYDDEPLTCAERPRTG